MHGNGRMQVCKNSTHSSSTRKLDSLANISVAHSMAVSVFVFSPIIQVEISSQTDDENRFKLKIASQGHSRSSILKSLESR